MNCDCQEIFKKIKLKVQSKETDMQAAYGLGPTSVMKVRIDIMSQVRPLLKQRCNCFIGQNFQVLQTMLESFFKNMDKFKKEQASNIFYSEVGKTFDKMIRILYNIGDVSRKN